MFNIYLIMFLRNEFYLELGKKNNLSIGTHIVEPDLNLLRKNIQDGYNFIAYSVDIRMLSVAAKQVRDFLDKE